MTTPLELPTKTPAKAVLASLLNGYADKAMNWQRTRPRCQSSAGKSKTQMTNSMPSASQWGDLSGLGLCHGWPSGHVHICRSRHCLPYYQQSCHNRDCRQTQWISLPESSCNTQSTVVKHACKYPLLDHPNLSTLGGCNGIGKVPHHFQSSMAIQHVGRSQFYLEHLWPCLTSLPMTPYYPWKTQIPSHIGATR